MFLAKKIKVCTHSGSFHSDDVFAAAVLELALKPAQLEFTRTREEKVISESDYVFDVGGIYAEAKNRFDHHQRGGAGEREGGVPYASFGLVWKKFGEKIVGSAKLAKLFDQTFVQYIDVMDSGVGELKPVFKNIYPYTIVGVIFSFLPTWREKEADLDQRFKNAVIFAKELILREVQVLKDEEEGKDLVRKIYQNTSGKRLILFEKSLPWAETLAEFPEPLFVVEPSDEDGNIGNWKVKTVRDNIFSFKNRKDLPATWAGRRDSELAEITGVSDATFCHNKLFIAVAKSKSGALALAKIAIDS